MHNSTRTRVASSPPAITPTRPAGGVTARTKLKTRAAAGDKPLSGVHEPVKPVHGHQAPGDKRLKHAAGPVRISPVRPPGPAVARVRPTGARRAALASGGALALAACAALVVGVPNAREALWPRTVAITYQDPPSASALRGQAQPGANRPAEASPRPRRTQSQPERPVQAGRSSADASPPPSIEPPRVVAGANLAPSGSGEAKPVQGSSQAALALPPAHMDRPSAAGPFRAVRDCSQCPEMVQLPGGAFAMGGREDPSEKPVHAVTVPPFAIGRFPVTLGEWRRCVAAQACDYDPGGEDASPVRNLSWDDARQYVAWLSKVAQRPYRLPTEAEWEYAARGGTTARHWWGDRALTAPANCQGCDGSQDARAPLPVGSFRPNPFGLYDMGGGVEQWVSDCWHKDYAGAPRDGTAWVGPVCRERVLRGGHWRSDPTAIRTASRNFYDPTVRYPTHGFRVARSR